MVSLCMLIYERDKSRFVVMMTWVCGVFFLQTSSDLEVGYISIEYDTDTMCDTVYHYTSWGGNQSTIHMIHVLIHSLIHSSIHSSSLW